MGVQDDSPGEDYASLFDFLPIGAYRTTLAGGILRANPAMVQINGYESEAQMKAVLSTVGVGWYVDPGRRAEFVQLMERDGRVKGFVSEIRQWGSSATIWVSENAYVTRDASGKVLYFEGTVEDINERVMAQKALQESQVQFNLITSQIPGMVFVVHVAPDGRRTYRYVSDGVRGIYGLNPEDVISDSEVISRYRHPDDVALFQADLKRLEAHPAGLGGEYRVVLPNGEVKWLLRHSCAASSDVEGQLRVGVLIDITSRKRAEAALLESEALWRLAMESAGDGVWDWNLVTGEEFLSDGIKAMFGLPGTKGTNLAANLDYRTHPDDLAQMAADRQAHFDGATPVYRSEHRVRCEDGSWKWVLSRGVVISRDEDDKPMRMVGTHTDITEIKQAEGQKRLLEAQLREAQKLEAIGTLAGGVAHDFNNLLAVILGNLALACEDVGSDHPAQESLNEINRATVRARHLVQQILAFSRRQAQELRCQPLRPLVAETLTLMRTLLPAGVKQLEDFSAEPLHVLADATQIQQVLMNLCTNAWQAMEGRGGRITIGLHSVEVDKAMSQRLGGIGIGPSVRLSVIDDGQGMDTATLQRVFEPFFTSKPPGSGTGLGLAVVHGIVKAHKGAIDVQSQAGQGTRFDVYLPRELAEQELSERAEFSPLLGPVAAAPNGRHVVYIDDYEAMVFLVARLLRKQGYQVSTFTSGEAAMAWLGSYAGPLDVVVSDQNMPGISGIEVALRVKQLRPNLRTVLLTGQVSDERLAQASAAGVVEVMGKQDSMADLGEAIRAVLEKLVLSDR